MSISSSLPSRRTVSPGWSGDLMWGGGGYASTTEWRLGGAVHAAFSEAKRTTRQGQVATASNEMVWPLSIQVTHFYEMNSTFTLSYEDETVLGPVKNTSLSRSIALQYSYRWAE